MLNGVAGRAPLPFIEIKHEQIQMYFHRFFTENTDKRAAACSSYFTMPDDTSVLSKDCKQLGYNSKGHSYPNQWGYKVTNLLRLYHRVLNRAGGGHSISFTDGNFYCDDQKRDNYKVGDKWILFVR